MKKPKADYAIQTVINALRLLEAFRDEEELGVTELSRRLALHKNNVFRLLATLEQRSYIEQSPESDRYRLDVRALELGQSFARGRSLLRRANPILRELAEETKESAHLGLMREFEVVCVGGVASDRLVRTGLHIGSRLPAHCTALGKVLLGCARKEVREAYDRRVVEDRGLDRLTRTTIVDRDKLFEHLRTVAVQGFAVDLGEYEEGVCCAAAPVLDGNGEVAAALSVSGPEFRLGEERLFREVIPVLTDAADHLSRDLGYVA